MPVFRSFHQRILLLVVGLIVVAQLTTFLAVLETLDRDVRIETRRQLTAGTELLGRLLEKRSRLLLNSAQVLAADYGFKSAIASRDRQTIRSALSNNLSRIDADMASLIALDGRLVSSTHEPDGTAGQYARIATRAEAAEIFRETTVLAGEARQIVVVPVKAPLKIGWLLLGFSLNDSLATELARPVGMEVSFAGQTDGEMTYFGSTLSAARKAALPPAIKHLQNSEAGGLAILQNETYLTEIVSLNPRSGSVSAILQKSLETALQSYRRLRSRLILLASLALATAVGMAFWMAHSLTRPVHMLSQAAARIRDGHYDVHLDLNRRDEFGDLADTFNSMQAGIAERELRIEHQAFHDDLTELPNLRLARDRLRQQIAVAERRQEPVAVIVLGVDRFKQVTETLGSPVGDRLIRKLAERLVDRVRTGDTVARIAPDEFMVIATGTDAAAASDLLDAVLPRMHAPIMLDDAELVPSVSAGVSIFPQHGRQVTELARRADIALTDARESQNRIGFYEFGRDENHLRQLSLVADLKRAVDENQLVMHYQPKISMRDRQVSSCEALVRWVHPKHGFMPPDEFIGLAEKSGNISMLSNWILQHVIAQLAQWRSEGVSVRAAINLSALDLQDDGLPDRISSYLGPYELTPQDLIIEVTESATMRDADKALQVLETLRSRGFMVSIDDFGTGYSSLSKLRDLPIDELKIDRSFIIDIQPDTTEALIVKAIIDLGHSMGMKITTEGIETRDEWNLLQQLGSDTIQGYYISRPLPAPDFGPWWRDHQAGLRQAA